MGYFPSCLKFEVRRHVDISLSRRRSGEYEENPAPRYTSINRYKSSRVASNMYVGALKRCERQTELSGIKVCTEN